MKGRAVIAKRLPIRLIIISGILIFYTVGLIGHLFEATRPLMLAITPYFLLLFGLIPLAPVIRERSRGVILWAASTLLITFFLEALGTHTGLIFGPYTYGSTLGFKLFKVPVVIALNWLIVIVAALSLTRSIRSPYLAALLVGATAALFDFVMEPVAISLDYWIWHTPEIPLQNYLAWFVIAFVSALVFRLCRLKVEDRIPVIYIAVQFIFFLILRLVLVPKV
jgi:putative membrane protein